MPHFTNNMTSTEAKDVFFELFEKMMTDEISMEEFGEIVKEYKNVSNEILTREAKEWHDELQNAFGMNSYTVWFG